MIEVGRLCVKIAGRDAGRKCVIVDVVDKQFCVIDGDVRRRKCNMLHLEPLDQVLTIKKGASSEDVKKEFNKLGFDVWKTKPKQAGERPRQQRSSNKKAPATPKAEKTKEEKPKKVAEKSKK
jgi:large subunit ribosomal protein L14e